MPDDFRKRLSQFVESLPHARALGLKLEHVADGVVEISMPYSDDLIGDPRTGVIHGGAVSTLMDTCCGTSVVAHAERPVGTATIDLRIDYMRAATPNQTITARAECYHITRNVAFVRAVAMDEDRDRPVASATGAFTVEWMKEAAK